MATTKVVKMYQKCSNVSFGKFISFSKIFRLWATYLRTINAQFAGAGIRNRIVRGGSVKPARDFTKTSHIMKNNLYHIPKSKINRNILEIRYTKNNHLTNFKSQYISSELKDVIMDLIKNKKLNKTLYNKLKPIDKHLMRSIMPYFETENLVDADSDDEFNKDFEIVRGEIMAGNDSMLLKKKAKQYLLHAYNMNKISKKDFENMKWELDL